MDKLSIFDIKSDWLKDEIYVHGLKEEVKEIASLFGPVKLSKMLGVSYDNCFREWTHGRAPVRFSKLIEMIELCNSETQLKLKEKIDAKELFISCMYSPHKMKFPKELSENLSYCTGLILGDGTLSGNSQNDNGNWGVSVIFDDIIHLEIYQNMMENEFGIVPKICKPKNKNCFTAYFCSKPTHWFLRSFLDMHNGYKASKISIPEKILKSKNPKLIIALLQGLFDSDGTVTKKDVRYASTSKLISDQILKILREKGITCFQNTWIKDQKFLPLHSVVVCRKSSVLSFAQQIGFRHPKKASKLAAKLALSSSGQG